MSGDSHRVEKVEKELRDIIAEYVLRHFTSEMLGVTQVKITRDLRNAKVYISALGEIRVSDDQLKEVQAHAFDMQKVITKKLRMRYCPKIQFAKDEGNAAAQIVDDLLNKIKN